MRVSVWAIAFWLCSVGIGAEADAGTRQPTSIGAQELAPALQILTRERGVQVVYRSELVVDCWTAGVNGNLTLDEALTQLLSSTGLTYRYLGAKAITIVPADSGAGPAPVKIVTTQ